MAMDPQLKRTLTETAYVALRTGVSDSGDPTYGEPAPILVRSEYDVQFHGPMFFPRHGEDQEGFTRLFSEVEIPTDAQVWMPGDDPEDPDLGVRCKRREVCRDIDGNISHFETYF